MLMVVGLGAEGKRGKIPPPTFLCAQIADKKLIIVVGLGAEGKRGKIPPPPSLCAQSDLKFGRRGMMGGGF